MIANLFLNIDPEAYRSGLSLRQKLQQAKTNYYFD